MPVYVYRCTQCGYRSEQRRSIEERQNELDCPSCDCPEPMALTPAVVGSVYHPTKTSRPVADLRS